MNIFELENINYENSAMLQALYSRSNNSAIENLKKLDNVNEFLQKYVINYDHRSILDCASTTIFIEDVSFLAAKCIQNNKLYNGVESSSRFLNYSSSKCYGSNPIYDELFDFYRTNYQTVFKHYEKKLNNSRAARSISFDIMRGFLPVGCKTKLSWHGTFRNLYEHSLKLKYSSLKEVKEIGFHILSVLKSSYPNSFNFKERIKSNTIDPFFEFKNNINLLTDIKIDLNNFDLASYNINKQYLNNNIEIFNEMGLINITYKLDYGSFRDLQRHRNGYQRLPLITGKNGFNDDYILMLPDELKYKAESLVNNIFKQINDLGMEVHDKQYFYPLGTNILNNYICTLPQLIYILKLRSNETVHFSLRKLILKIIKFCKYSSLNLKIEHDNKPFDFISFKRGEQDIYEIK